MGVKNKASKGEEGIDRVEDRLRVEYVPLATLVLWDTNPKKHDEGAIWESIQLHGFKDPPKFEPKLNGGRGGIVEGNGRSKVLHDMRVANEMRPRGILLDSEGGWLVPVLFGVDAVSEKAAHSYGIDHNNLVLSGGDFDDTDIAKLWDPQGYASLLASIGNSGGLPISVDGDDLDALIQQLTRGSGAGSGDGAGSGAGAGDGNNLTGSGKEFGEKWVVHVICEDEDAHQETYEALQALGYKLSPVNT